MEPEEIDKLFKNRLAGLPATPSADAWARLQQKMEPPKQQKTVWLYYVAASISILLIAGVLYFKNFDQLEEIKVAQAENKVQPIEQKTEPRKEADNIAASELADQVEVVQATPGHIDNKNSALTSVAEVTSPEANKPVLALSAAQKSNTKRKNVAPAATPIEIIEEPAVAVIQEKPSFSEEEALTTTTATPAKEVIEVIIKRDANPEIASADEEMDMRQEVVRKGKLLKNVYKQVRNLKNGERVELATLGVNTDRINVESKAIKEKLSNLISL